MSESKIQLVEPQSLSVDFPGIGAIMTVRAESNEIFILVGSTRFPRDDVVNFHIDIAACRDSAAMPRFDKDAPTEIGRYRRSTLRIIPEGHASSSSAKNALSGAAKG